MKKSPILVVMVMATIATIATGLLTALSMGEMALALPPGFEHSKGQGGGCGAGGCGGNLAGVLPDSGFTGGLGGGGTAANFGGGGGVGQSEGGVEHCGFGGHNGIFHGSCP
jgi:hypothetical protein